MNLPEWSYPFIALGALLVPVVILGVMDHLTKGDEEDSDEISD